MTTVTRSRDELAIAPGEGDERAAPEVAELAIRASVRGILNRHAAVGLSVANEALGVGALSYAGTFSIGIVADRDAYPDVDVFVAGVRDDLHALGVTTHVALSRAGADASGGPPDREGRPAIDPRFAVRYSTKPLSAAERR
jgi:hypothetical protein